MENFETSDLSNENIENQQTVMPEAESQEEVAEETVYRGSGAGRKESPYANSPYVMQHPASEASVREKKASYFLDRTRNRRVDGSGYESTRLRNKCSDENTVARLYNRVCRSSYML